MKPIELFEKAIAGNLSETEQADLEQMVKEDKETRRAYIEYLDLHGALYWESTSSSREPFSLDEFAVVEFPRPKKRVIPTLLKIAAAIALLAGGFGLGNRLVAPGEPVIAVLESAKNCRWSSGSLPTNSGAQLGAGQLSLAEGLATIVFSSGATVQLEGPAELTLIDPMRCELISGTLVANVPEEAQGFTVDTRTAELIDFGTEFGVSVDGTTGETHLEVFTGEVDIARRESGEVVRLTEGQSSRVGGDFFEVDESANEETTRFGLGDAIRSGEVLIEATEDAYIAAPGTTSHSSETLLLAKTPEHKRLAYSRKIYLQFDIGAGPVQDATLELWLRRSGFGYASFVEDAVFEVYGLKESATWRDDDLEWNTAPANRLDSRNGILEEEVISLGEFVVPQGVDSGRVDFSTPELASFLSERSGLTTLIVVRATVESRGGGLVHAFASTRDPSGGAPQLRLRR